MIPIFQIKLNDVLYYRVVSTVLGLGLGFGLQCSGWGSDLRFPYYNSKPVRPVSVCLSLLLFVDGVIKTVID